MKVSFNNVQRIYLFSLFCSVICLFILLFARFLPLLACFYILLLQVKNLICWPILYHYQLFSWMIGFNKCMMNLIYNENNNVTYWFVFRSTSFSSVWDTSSSNSACLRSPSMGWVLWRCTTHVRVHHTWGYATHVRVHHKRECTPHTWVYATHVRVHHTREVH